MRAAALSVLAILVMAAVASACPFCNAESGKTFLEEVKESNFVVYGRVLGADEGKNTTEVALDLVVKDSPLRPKAERFTIKKFLDPSLVTDKERVMLFCDAAAGSEVDAYRGEVVRKGSKLPEYLKGLREREGKSMTERLRWCFDFLDDPDFAVSSDAYREFARCDYKDFKEMAKTLPSDRILKWLKDPSTLAFRYGLYASMLGHCGKDADADVVRKLLDDPDRRLGGVDGLLAAYVMLRPREGFTYLKKVLASPKEDFMYRYAALRSIRFLHDFRKELVTKKELVEAACLLLDQKDIADMAIEDLRKWKAWETAPRVLAVATKPWFNEETVVKRSVLRYSIEARGVPLAEAYLAKRTAEDAEAVKDARELLELEKPAPKK